MQYCSECGQKLPTPNPKHCTECGATLSSAKETPAREVARNTGLFQLIVARRRSLVAGLLLLLALAVLTNVFVGAGLADAAKAKQSEQEAQLRQFELTPQDDSQMQQEDLRRQQILADSKKAAELGNSLKQFLSALQYDAVQMQATGNEYESSGELTYNSLPKKAAAARKFALQVNEYASHVDGMKAFIHQNLADLQNFSNDSINETAMDEQLDSTKVYFRGIEHAVELELEAFVDSDPLRMSMAGDTIEVLKESQGLP
ncbi:MAG: hypothetical protein NT157_01630 [Candidatus Micrarchaeota archaeon]|nr:hypothetical protein [Candidatus Micrarchaeota archaeon]